MARSPTVQTPKGHTAAVSAEHPSTRAARHSMTVTKIHGALRGPLDRSTVSEAKRANYDAVKPGPAGSKMSDANAKLNAEMLRGGVEPRVSVTPSEASALKFIGSKTY